MTSRRVSVTLDANVSPFNRALMSASASTKAWAKELESSDNRLSNVVQTAMALAPALAPLSAAAVPAIAGLTNQLGFAAVAGGTAMIAFQGVGDALGALNDYYLDQSPEKLKKVQQAMREIGPAGAVFVHQLQELRPELQALQDVAGQSMFPGWTNGIESLMTQMPRFEGVIEATAGALGRLADDAGSSLAGPEWSEFFDYLDREAAPTLEAMGKSIGNVIEGVTNMVMALDPLSDDFTSGMLDMSEAFVSWSDNLDSSQGFQEFVAYVRESGPQAMETLSAIAGALIEFVEAAAPVGAVVLPVIEVLADALGSIADSSLGPIIVGTAAAVGVLGRSLAVLNAVGLRGGGESMIAKIFAVDTMKQGVAAFKQGQRSLYNITTASERATMSATKLAAAHERQAAAEQKRTAAMKAGAAQFGKTAVAAGGLALATSGAADGIGLTNTASMAMMGTLAGPWGAAVGGGVGLLMDLANAGDLAESAQQQLGSAVRAAGTDFEAQNKAIEDGQARLDSYWDKQSFLATSFEGWDLLLTGESAFDGLAEAQRKAEDQALDTQQAFSAVAMAMGEDFKDSIGRSVQPTLADLTRTAEAARPAMEALGISAEDLANMDSADLQVAAKAIADWTSNADSAQGRTQAVADSFAALDDQMVDTASSADQMKSALDALIDPALNLSAANDAWIASLRSLAGDLDATNKSLRGNSNAALTNRDAIRDRVGAMKDVLEAEAKAGGSSEQLASKLRNQRQALLQAGDAAGISRKQMNDYLNTLGLTPKLVKTLVQAETSAAMANINGFKFRWDQLKSKTLYLTMVERRTGPGGQGNGYSPSADGSTVPKTGKPYADRHLYLLADGEEVISNRYGQADRHRALLKDINANRLADGGTAGKRRQSDDDKAERRQERLDAEAERRAQQELVDRAEASRREDDERFAEFERRQQEAILDGQQRAAEQLLDAARAQEDAAKSVMESWQQAMDRTGANATSGFRNDLWSQDSGRSGLWTGALGGGSSWRDVLNSDIAGLTERDSLINQLGGTGITGAALEELMRADNSTISGMLQSGEVGDFAELFNQRAALTDSVGAAAGQAAYGAEFAAAASQVAALGQQVIALNQRLAQITAQRPITVNESISGQAAAAEIARLGGFAAVA